MEILKISLKNVLYNKSRTVRTFLILSFGALMYAFTSSLLGGMMDQSIKDSINEETADIRIRALNYDEDLPYSDTNYFKADINKLSTIEGIKYCERILVKGEIDNYENSLPIVVIGVDSLKDKEVFSIPATTTEYPKDGRLWIGSILAHDMGVKEGDYINVSFRSYDGVYISSEYEVSGIVKSSMPIYSEQAVIIDIEDMKNLFSKDMTSQYNIRLSEGKQLDKMYTTLKELYKDNEVLTWKELLKELFYNIETRKYFVDIFLVIIMFVALLGLTNSVLISAWEKRKITAMMRAMGFYDRDIIFLFIFEGAWIALLGALVGVIIAALINIPVSIYGFDITAYMEGMNLDFYMPPVFRSNWDIKNFLVPIILMPICAMAASYFPSRRSIKMTIVEALRTKN